jgi:hypothetical protein
MAASPVGDTNVTGITNGSLNIAYKNAGNPVYDASSVTGLRSVGLAFVDAASSGAYSATVALGGTLTFIAKSSTAVAISSDGGTFSATSTSHSSVTGAFSSGSTAVAFSTTASGTARTAVATWTAPSTSGSYTIKYYVATPPGTSATTPDQVNPLKGDSIATVTVTVGGSHPIKGASLNGVDTLGGINTSLFVAVIDNATVDAALHTVTVLGQGESTAKSKGLLAKDTSFGTAQTATVLAGGKLSLYAQVSTTSAFTASGGTFASSAGIGATATYAENLRTTLLSGPTQGSVATVATIWTAPSAAGTYTVQLGVGDGAGNLPSLTSPTPALAGAITVTVVAASTGGTYSAAYSACNTATTSAAGSSTYPSGVDASSTPVANGGSWYIDFDIDDAYDASLPSTTNVTVSASNGALVSIGDAGSQPAVGTASTLVTPTAPTNKTVRVVQGAAGPVTTTVTITINATVACTKTVTIAGEVAKLTVSGVGTQDLGAASTAVYSSRDADADGRTDGLFTVVATDSAGNRVATSGVGTFSYVASTLTPIVQMVTVNSSATSNSSTSAYSSSLGAWTCGSTAGTSNVKVQYTNTSTGTVITSDSFAARCAGAPHTYTASFDKASYVQGELATLTVKFLDSKGNAANQTVLGAKSIITPMMTGVSSTTSATSYAKADGTRSYTFTVGGTTAVTAGSYVAVVDYTALTDVDATKATPAYKVSTGSTDVAFSEVLKSVVALIASINKQIQALQKLILKR